MCGGQCSARRLCFAGPDFTHSSDGSPTFRSVIIITPSQGCSEAHSQPGLHFVVMTTEAKPQEVRSAIVAELMERAEETPHAVVDQEADLIAGTRGRCEGPQLPAGLSLLKPPQLSEQHHRLRIKDSKCQPGRDIPNSSHTRVTEPL